MALYKLCIITICTNKINYDALPLKIINDIKQTKLIYQKLEQDITIYNQISKNKNFQYLINHCLLLLNNKNVLKPSQFLNLYNVIFKIINYDNSLNIRSINKAYIIYNIYKIFHDLDQKNFTKPFRYSINMVSRNYVYCACGPCD